MNMKTEPLELISSTGNIFEDMGCKDAEQRLAKAKLVSRIQDIIDKNEWDQKTAGKLLNINQPKVSALLQGRLEGFSMERLMTFLTRLDQDITITIQEKPSRRKDHGHFNVAFA
jgi:predicted XRE-type DNA-binding protein